MHYKGGILQNPKVTGKGGAAERTDISFAAEAALTMSIEDLMEDETHQAVVARHMQYFRQLYDNRARAKGMKDVKAKYATAVLKPWQQSLLDVCDGDVSDRKVYWFNDVAGNTGKSWMVGYLMAHRGAVCFTNGKLADIACAYAYEPIVIFDLSRTQADKIDHVYMAIENFKNGRIFSPKYNSHTKLLAPPHVIVFANFVDDEETRKNKLSEDRWVIMNM